MTIQLPARAMNVAIAVLASIFFSLSAARAGDAPLPWHGKPQPSDVAKDQVQDVDKGEFKYVVTQGGTMDGRSCRSPMGCGMSREGAFFQTWESNRSVRMENVGTSDVVNPWLSNGRNLFRTADEIVASAVTPGMTDAEKAFAIWFQQIRYRHHTPGDNLELGDPVKVFNVYGYNTCGNDSICLATLWRKTGHKAAPARALGHCISQVFYDDRWHFYDGDMHSVYLLRDNQTVAGEQDLVHDHDLVKRTHSQGILLPDDSATGSGMAALYCFEGPVTGERSGKADTTMNMVLRPGEAIEWRWGQASPLKYHAAPQSDPVYKDAICNGLWEYRPDFTSPIWRAGAATIEHVTQDADGLAAEGGKTATVIWTIRSPYVLVGGRLETEGTGAKFFICLDGKTWQPASDNLDKFFPSVGPACYQYQIKCQLEPTARLKHLAIVNDLQMAPLALPEMGVGPNAFTYTDASPGDRKVRITHRWVERSASSPPEAPTTPVYPPDGGESNGTDITFEWNPAKDPDADAIADYQFELSARSDMAFPLSMSFYKLISRTADATGEKNRKPGADKNSAPARYTLPEAGLLTPDRKYFWHVRAKDDKGVWGPWSATWNFTARGAAQPLDVTLDFDTAKGTGTLRWKANTIGRTPVRYRVYGSDEKGFTIADERRKGVVGVSKVEMAAWNPWFPPNFIAETTATELPVIGSEVSSSEANRTYYRVVAVDEQARRCGPSDYATAPRPILYSQPVTHARLGVEYRYELRATRSLGDLSAREEKGHEVHGYFQIEHPRFALEKGPGWLRIDPATGVLSGTPDVAGSAEVAVTVTIDESVRRLDESALKWGNEKVLGIETQRMGSHTQKFVIQVD